MGKQSKAIGDFNVCLESANQFYSVAAWCYDRDAIDFMTNTMYPYAVNISFACELYLKAIMIKHSSQSEFNTGHDLLTLFNSLDANDQAAINNYFIISYPSKSLRDFLDENRAVFVDWRYALEKQVEVNVSGFNAFVEALREHLKNLK